MRLIHPLIAFTAVAALHAASDETLTATVTVTDKGFDPPRIMVPVDRTVVIVFRRTVENTCATALLWPETGIQQELPVGKDVRVSLRAKVGQAIPFACPMKMYTGEVVAGPAQAALPATAVSGATEIQVDGRGFHPDRIAVKAGSETHLHFTRTSDSTCATAVRIPKLGIPDRALPLNHAIDVTITQTQVGEFAFTCPMEMVSGTIVVEPTTEPKHAP